MCGLNEQTGEVDIIGMPARLSWVIQESALKVLDETLSNPNESDHQKSVVRTNINDFLSVTQYQLMQKPLERGKP